MPNNINNTPKDTLEDDQKKSNTLIGRIDYEQHKKEMLETRLEKEREKETESLKEFAIEEEPKIIKPIIKVGTSDFFGKKKTVSRTIKEEITNQNNNLTITKPLIAKPDELITYTPKLKATKKKTDFLAILKDPRIYIALSISITSGILFFYTTFSSQSIFFSLFGNDIKLQHLIVITSILLFLFNAFFVFLLKKNLIASIHIFTALATLQISSFLYSLRIFGVELFSYSNVTITTQIVIVILPIIILLQTLDLIQNKNRMWVVITQVFVVFNQLFSNIKFLNDNNFQDKSFSAGVINILFGLPTFFWVFFATLGIAILSTYKLKKVGMRFVFVFGVMFPILNILIFTKVSTYWYQTIMALIVWDMFYTPMHEGEQETDKRILSKLTVSSVYHIFLFLVLLVFNTVYNFLVVTP